MVQALQSVGEEKLVDLALGEEHSKCVSQVSLMLKYGIIRNRPHKVITGTSIPGGSQYLSKGDEGQTCHTTEEKNPG